MEFNPILVFSLLGLMAAGAVAMIAIIIRFSYGSKRAAKEEQQRLRVPRPEEFAISHAHEVANFYRTSAFIDDDLALRAPDGKIWEIQNFIPFTKRDASEWQKITGVAGIPIALDYTRGVYFLSTATDEPTVFYQPVGWKKSPVVVASSIQALGEFERVEEDTAD